MSEKEKTSEAVPSVATIEHQFKNFHRMLCERFGYTHDERDWKRDQVSLMEWIASQRQGELAGYVNGDELDNMLDDRTATIQGSRSGIRATPLYRALAATGTKQAEIADLRAALEAMRKDAERWRFTMEWQELARTGVEQPEPLRAMWRKVYAEHRLHPTREEYESATDASIALLQRVHGQGDTKEPQA